MAGVDSAQKLFNEGISKRTDELLDKAGADIKRGASEQASEHLKRAMPLVAHGILNPKQGLLSDDEHVDLIRLTNKYISFEAGLQVYHLLEDHETKKLEFLRLKARGLAK